MAEVMSPQATNPTTYTTTTSSPPPPSHSPDSSTADSSRTTTPQSKSQLSHDRLSSDAAAKRLSTYSRSSQQSTRAQSSSLEYPAFASSLPYALVRDFAYPSFHPSHYGVALEPSRSSTPTSEWNGERRRSDPMEAWNNAPSSHGGWSAGPWGGDGVMYGDPEHEDNLASLPSTSFGSEVAQAHFGGADESHFLKGKHRKSKSYGNISEFERGRRRDSSQRSRGDGNDAGVFWFQGQPGDPRRARGNSGAGNDPNGARRDSPFATTLPSRSFHTPHNHDTDAQPDDDEEQIPLDTEPHTTHSPQRDSMGPEDEELFAGPSLALYSFEPENSNELRLEEGQEIMVSYRHGQGWLVASDPETGEQGLVPEAYVRLIADMPNYDPEKGEFVDFEEDDEDESTREGWREESTDFATGGEVKPVAEGEQSHDGDGGGQSGNGKGIESSETTASKAKS